MQRQEFPSYSLSSHLPVEDLDDLSLTIKNRSIINVLSPPKPATCPNVCGDGDLCKVGQSNAAGGPVTFGKCSRFCSNPVTQADGKKYGFCGTGPMTFPTQYLEGKQHSCLGVDCRGCVPNSIVVCELYAASMNPMECKMATPKSTQGDTYSEVTFFTKIIGKFPWVTTTVTQ